MKAFLIYSLIFSVLFSCSKNQKNSDENDATDDVKVSPVSLIDYSYVWLSQSYYDGLLNDLTHADLYDVSDISFIAMSPNQNNMIIVSDFYSGSGYDQTVINGKLLLYGDDMNNQHNDTLTVNIIRPDNLISINGDTLFKTHIQDSNYLLESILFAGNYKLNGQEASVEIDSSGMITNFFDYNHMMVESTQAKETGYNAIIMTGPKSGKQFLYEFSGDTLKLYDQNCTYFKKEGETCLTHENLLYSLIKIND